MSGEVVVVDRSQALTVGDIESVDGTYGVACDGRSGAWSLSVLETGANDELTVALNDTDCDLTLTDIITVDGGFAAGPPMALGTTFGTVSQFGTPVQFFAVASVSTIDFEEDFVVTVLYSNDPALLDASNDAEFAMVESSFSEGAVPAPDYTIDVTGIDLSTDANDVVVGGAGEALLTEGDVSSPAYVMYEGGDLDTYAELSAVYALGTEVVMAASIDWADFVPLGEDLTAPAVRTVIIANTVSGVTSFQAFELTFNPAS